MQEYSLSEADNNTSIYWVVPYVAGFVLNAWQTLFPLNIPINPTRFALLSLFSNEENKG